MPDTISFARGAPSPDLIPVEAVRVATAKALEDDYARMVEDGLLFDDAEPFEALMARCADIAARANSSAI